MATKNSSDRDFVRCLDCKHATFRQWYENPIVAQCSIFNERMVAQSNRLCKEFAPSRNAHPDIEHFDNYDIAKEEELKKFFTT